MIIVSDVIAKEDIKSVLDWVHRDAEIRSDTRLLIAKDQKAYEILRGKVESETGVSLLLGQILQSQPADNSYIDVELYSFITALSKEGISPTAPTTNLVEYGGEKIPQIYGTAVFKKDKMVGWLNGTETKSLSWLLGKYYQGLVVVKDLDKKDANIAYEVFSKNTQMKPFLDHGQLTIKITIKNHVSIASFKNVDPVFQDEHRLAQLEIELQNYLERQIKHTIDKVQHEFNSDIFGFGALVQREMPEYWKKVNQSWEEEFPKVQVEVVVDTNIDGSGFNLTPIKVRY